MQRKVTIPKFRIVVKLSVGNYAIKSRSDGILVVIICRGKQKSRSDDIMVMNIRYCTSLINLTNFFFAGKKDLITLVTL